MTVDAQSFARKIVESMIGDQESVTVTVEAAIRRVERVVGNESSIVDVQDAWDMLGMPTQVRANRKMFMDACRASRLANGLKEECLDILSEELAKIAVARKPKAEAKRLIRETIEKAMKG